jgi:hypothetical protein
MYKFYESLLLCRGLPLAYGCAELNEKEKKKEKENLQESFKK